MRQATRRSTAAIEVGRRARRRYHATSRTAVAVLLACIGCTVSRAAGPTAMPVYLGHVGDTARLTPPARVTGLGTRPRARIDWSSASRSVVSVDSTGVVRVTGLGVTTVVAVLDGDTAYYTVVSAPPVLVGAGDIASCESDGDEATAALLDRIPGIVFTAGDNAYPRGSAAELAACYGPSWGRHKDRTLPAPGNHDYRTRGAAAYYRYFGRNAGEPGAGYYRYTLGDWDVFVLNSQVDIDPRSAQVRWLRGALATTRRRCQVAIMHLPRFSSGPHGGSRKSRAIWSTLYDGNADVVIAGHDHIYERFAPQNPAGAADPARGIREFVVGTGGSTHYPLRRTPAPNSDARDGDTFGVLRLALNAGSYDWQFIPVAGGRFTDSGRGTCH
jgi:hypothetical protein